MPKTLNLIELAELVGVHKMTMRRMIKDGRFNVAPVPGTKPPRWNKDHVEAWLAGEVGE